MSGWSPDQYEKFKAQRAQPFWDLVALIDPRQIAEAKSAGLETQINQKNSSWVIYVSLTRKNLGDARVRQALMYAIDREGLADALSFGSGKPSVQLFAETSPVFVAELARVVESTLKRAAPLLPFPASH